MPVDPVSHCSLITGLGPPSWVKIYIRPICYILDYSKLDIGPNINIYSLDVYTTHSPYDINVAGVTFTLMYLYCRR